ncbi:MAG: type VI secretion protein [Rickettsiaceae bacterium]|nr:type VI secretion protein [Rickettsiaceae bacterium]
MSDNLIREYIDSGEYFAYSRKWYYGKYVAPLTQKSFLMVVAAVFVATIGIVLMETTSMFPLSHQVKYFISVEDANSENEKYAKVIRATAIPDNPLRSILKIMIEDYVTKRERYNHDLLDQQVQYVQGTSTRRILNQYSDYLSIDNPNSPILRYQSEAKRNIVIRRTNFIDDNNVEVYFDSKAEDDNGKIFENLGWVVRIGFDADPIALDVPNGTDYKFVVTDYNLKLIRDYNAH